MSAHGPVEASASFHAARRLFEPTIAGGSLRDTGDHHLEHSAPIVEPPRVVGAEPIEGATVRARRVEGDPDVGFAAFLDGIQRSRVVHYVGAIPVVHGTVAAVVRRRINRRLTTWRRPLVRSRLYLPSELAPDAWARALEAGWEVRDTSAIPEPLAADAHPFELLTRAVHAVQDDREEAERTLAEEWCGIERDPLFLDGGLSRSDLVARSLCVVGVVKSHRSLYAAGEAMRTVLSLRRGFRSSVVRVASSRRHAVASWYLRLHEPAGGDPMFGLVRVEAADLPGERREHLTERADRISRWVLAESAPLSLPDGRWDRMAYGIRDAEEVLRSLAG